MNDAFQALSDPTRREILRMLRRRDITAGEIAEQFELAKSTLSGHFIVLKHAGLIVAEKNGTSIAYSLNLSVVEETIATMMELFDVGAIKKPLAAKRRPAGRKAASGAVASVPPSDQIGARRLPRLT